MTTTLVLIQRPDRIAMESPYMEYNKYLVECQSEGLVKKIIETVPMPIPI
jgi:hypothetical protein